MLNSIKMKLKRSGTSPSASTTVNGNSSTASSTTSSSSNEISSSPSASSTSTPAHHNHALSASATAAVLDGSLPRADLGLPTQHNTNKNRRRSSISREATLNASLLSLNNSGGSISTSIGTNGASAINTSQSSSIPSNSLVTTLAAEAAAAHATAIAAAVVDLPGLIETPLAKREALFKQKLIQCSVVDINWDDIEADKKAKEYKRLALIELVDYINTPGGQKILTEGVYQDIINMISINIFRALPSSGSGSGNGEEVSTGSGGGEGGGDDDEPYIEPAWVHLQLVYEFLLRFVVSAEVKVKAAKKQIDTVFCSKLIELFDSEDPRERDYLKTILHRIYGKFLSHRSFIRKAISHVFFRFVYETDRHNGIGELLEILGSIINGFALPLKDEHVQFLERALIPLHRPKSVANYFQQLSFCMVQYIEKDPTTVANILRGIMRSWPWSSSSKQILLLNEIEELLEIAGPEAASPIMNDLFRLLSRCVGSSHFQVSERALFLWNNEVLITTGILSSSYATQAIPLLCEPLCKQANGHWNPTVESLAKNVVRHYEEADGALFDRIRAGTAKAIEDRQKDIQLRKQRWIQLEAEASRMAAMAPSLTSSSSSSSSSSPIVPHSYTGRNNNTGISRTSISNTRPTKTEQKSMDEDEEKETD